MRQDRGGQRGESAPEEVCSLWFSTSESSTSSCARCAKSQPVSCRAQAFAARHAHHPASLVTVLGS